MEKFHYTGGGQSDELAYVVTRKEYDLLQLGAGRLHTKALDADALGVNTDLSSDQVEDLKEEVIDGAVDARLYPVAAAVKGAEFILTQEIDDNVTPAEEEFVDRCLISAKAELVERSANERQFANLHAMREVARGAAKFIRRDSTTAG